MYPYDWHKKDDVTKYRVHEFPKDRNAMSNMGSKGIQLKWNSKFDF